MKALKILCLAIISVGLIFAGCSKMVPTEPNLFSDDGGLISLAKSTGSVWNVPEYFATIEDAIESSEVSDGDTILVGSGEHAGALLDKAVVIKGEGIAVINSGPLHSSGLIQGFRTLTGSSGATISHLRFEVDFPIMNGKAVDDVTVEHCQMTSPIQGISNWEGNNWNISHNVINGLRTRNGGGIGIFIGCYSGVTANNNLVSHNKITGQVVVPEDDGGGYSAPGICLMSDRRWGRPGGTITENRILNNKVELSSTNPDTVESVGIELTDLGLELVTPPVHDLTDNKVGFNDIRRVEDYPILLYPDPVEIMDENTISRNLGEDPDQKGRGHGVHPIELLEP